MKLIWRFIVNYLLAVDQLWNTLLLGHPDETLSSRLGRSIGRERYMWVLWFRIVVDTLFFWDYERMPDDTIKRHCERSVMPLEQQNFRTVADYEIWSWSREG